MALTDYQTLVDDLVRDDAGKIATPQRDRAIGLAVVRYGQDRPLTTMEDVAADGSSYLPLPAAWDDGGSALMSLEYPIGEWPVSYLAHDAYGVAHGPMGDEIRLAGHIQVGALVRAMFTLGHTLDESTDTVPDADREAVALYASAILMDQLASLYSGDGDSTISADSVEHRSQAQEYAARARGFRTRYFDALGIDPKRQVAACAVVNLDLSNSLGRDRLTHPKRYR
ncbi:MAG: hypothetical protein IPG66_05895 [Hydrogenophilales bacterium]|nr:hypothetical protein [Hydrogenophilales bacterium]